MKSNNLAYIDIFGQVRTEEERDLALSETEQITKSLFQKRLAENLPKFLRMATYRAIAEGISKTGNKEGLAKLQERLEKAKRQLEDMEILELTVAADPTENTIQEIYTWATQNLSDNVLIRIKKEKSILGGAVISYKGKYIDASLKSKLEKYFSGKFKI